MCIRDRYIENIPLDEKDYIDELNTIKYLAESNVMTEQ